jgi:hypothetical protein
MLWTYSLISRSSRHSNMTQRIAFERVFGSHYIKITVCRHKTIWRKAHQTIRDKFESMGEDDRAYWTEFVNVWRGRPPGKNAGPDVVSQTNSLNCQTPSNGEDVHSQDPGMNSMQNQSSCFIFRLILDRLLSVTSTPNNSLKQSGMFFDNKLE